jgi:DNA (cytosine-5)-methyltransferase 1
MMYKPLTENLGKELLMSYLEDFRARTLAQPERGGELLEAEVPCGNTWRELLGKYNPDTLLWKTAQCSLLEDLEQSLEIWPRWGSMRNGECFQQPMLAQITNEIEFGLSEKVPNNLDFFHTPCTTGLDGGSNSRKALKKRMEKMPTPLSSDYKGVQRMRDNHQNDLAAVVGGPVNPTFSEWLMGWPLEWTDLKPLETDKCLYVQQQPGDC